jgi:hypothetical protein
VNTTDNDKSALRESTNSAFLGMCKAVNEALNTSADKRQVAVDEAMHAIMGEMRAEMRAIACEVVEEFAAELTEALAALPQPADIEGVAEAIGQNLEKFFQSASNGSTRSA